MEASKIKQSILPMDNDNGYFLMQWPDNITQGDADDIMELIAILIRQIKTSVKE